MTRDELAKCYAILFAALALVLWLPVIIAMAFQFWDIVLGMVGPASMATLISVLSWQLRRTP